jgi:hypothetical protein
MSTSLTKKFLADDLTQTERMYLKSLSFHEGFPVLQKMFSEACRLANDDVIKTDPEEKDYEKILGIRQQRARNINEFCEAIRKSFNAHVDVATKEIEREAAKEEQLREKAN